MRGGRFEVVSGRSLAGNEKRGRGASEGGPGDAGRAGERGGRGAARWETSFRVDWRETGASHLLRLGEGEDAVVVLAVNVRAALEDDVVVLPVLQDVVVGLRLDVFAGLRAGKRRG